MSAPRSKTGLIFRKEMRVLLRDRRLVVGIVVEDGQALDPGRMAQPHALLPGGVAPAHALGVLVGQIHGVEDLQVGALGQRVLEIRSQQAQHMGAGLL